MSECVVRMEMPNGCHDCKLRNMVGNCPIPIFDGQDEEKIWTLAECFQRPPWCPIICQLPEGHGRLVDENEVKDWVENWLCVNKYYHPYSSSKYIPVSEFYDVLQRTGEAVPAERSET